MIDRIARNTPFWVPPVILASILIPHAIIAIASLRGENGTALLVLATYWLSRLASNLARKYYDPYRP